MPWIHTQPRLRLPTFSMYGLMHISCHFFYRILQNKMALFQSLWLMVLKWIVTLVFVTSVVNKIYSILFYSFNNTRLEARFAYIYGSRFFFFQKRALTSVSPSDSNQGSDPGIRNHSKQPVARKRKRGRVASIRNTAMSMANHVFDAFKRLRTSEGNEKSPEKSPKKTRNWTGNRKRELFLNVTTGSSSSEFEINHSWGSDE